MSCKFVYFRSKKVGDKLSEVSGAARDPDPTLNNELQYIRFFLPRHKSGSFQVSRHHKERYATLPLTCLCELLFIFLYMHLLIIECTVLYSYRTF